MDIDNILENFNGFYDDFTELQLDLEIIVLYTMDILKKGNKIILGNYIEMGI